MSDDEFPTDAQLREYLPLSRDEWKRLKRFMAMAGRPRLTLDDDEQPWGAGNESISWALFPTITVTLKVASVPDPDDSSKGLRVDITHVSISEKGLLMHYRQNSPKTCSILDVDKVEQKL